MVIPNVVTEQPITSAWGNTVADAVNAKPDIESGTYTPNLTTVNPGAGGVNVANYVFVGGPNVGDKGLLAVNGYLRFGSSGQTFPNNPTFSLPPGFEVWYADATTQAEPLGNAEFWDASVAGNIFIGLVRASNSTAFRCQVLTASGTYTTELGLAPTIPMTWAVNDEFVYTISCAARRI